MQESFSKPLLPGPTSLTTQYMGRRKGKHTGQPGAPSTPEDSEEWAGQSEEGSLLRFGLAVT